MFHIADVKFKRGHGDDQVWRRLRCQSGILLKVLRHALDRVEQRWIKERSVLPRNTPFVIHECQRVKHRLPSRPRAGFGETSLHIVVDLHNAVRRIDTAYQTGPTLKLDEGPEPQPYSLGSKFCLQPFPRTSWDHETQAQGESEASSAPRDIPLDW